VAQRTPRSTVDCWFIRQNVKPSIIFNPTAGSARARLGNREMILAKLKGLRSDAVLVTKKPGDAEKWARQKIRAGGNYLIVAGGGFHRMVHGKNATKIKRILGPITYLRGAAAAFTKLHSYHAQIVFDDEEEIAPELYNVVIANGRFVAGGLPIAPDADPADG